MKARCYTCHRTDLPVQPGTVTIPVAHVYTIGSIVAPCAGTYQIPHMVAHAQRTWDMDSAWDLSDPQPTSVEFWTWQ